MHFFSAANFVSCEAKYRGGCQTFDFFLFFSHFCLPASGQFVFTGVVTFPPRFLPSIFIAYRVQQSRCSSIFHRALLPHALALSASQFVHKKKSQRIYTSMHSAGLELTELTYTRLEDNLIRHRGDRLHGTGAPDFSNSSETRPHQVQIRLYHDLGGFLRAWSVV